MVKLLHSKLDRFAKLKKLVASAKKPQLNPHGYIYIGRIPPGFEEQNLKQFFSQFGKVTRSKLSRSKKTGRSRGFGFVEFADKAVAKIAAQTMHGFLLFGKQVVCEYLDEVSKFAMVPCKKNVLDTYTEFRDRYNSVKTEKELQKRVEKLLKTEEELRNKLGTMGISYVFPGFSKYFTN